MFPHQTSARAIGERYLASRPAVSRLISAVLMRLDEQSESDKNKSDRGVIMAAIKSDYRSSRLVEVDGWILSETEVAFCVIAAAADS